ncbi:MULTISPECIES: hypothetical protein [Bacillus]|uniref:hypothetical protein n=1 Tax=Bacillus TaxID=1386 RepID=UPI00099550DD|nr:MULTISPECIES: hypothetical protein [Bacillus cereus group]MCU5202169.1 hypothetical protein [Bacillus paranthracis]MDA2630918.1 hypothetical protein [Bacillus cereus]OPA03797.1 hypothetical protein BHL51_01880 [Bacillus cereus]PRC96261.1 hypothetical protein CQZ92_23655 [Bacillus cereus]PRD01451.1 hypothetical protein CQZ91_26400 [Bacillus cereus]
MNIISIILSLIIFSIIIILIEIFIWKKTKEITGPALQIGKGAAICLVSSGILLILKDDVTATYTNVNKLFIQEAGFSIGFLAVIIVGFFLLISILNAIKH